MVNKQIVINNCLQLLDNSYNIKLNIIKINITNSIEHELSKLKVVYHLVKDGKQVVTEAIFKNGGRADILIPEDMRVIEILHTETYKEALKKKNKYPEEIDIIFLHTKEILKENFEM